MITWNELVYDLTELAKLENGTGSEIEFTYDGKSYMIILYRGYCELMRLEGTDAIIKQYSTLDDLGRSCDFGFCPKEVWSTVEDLVCSPYFDEEPLEVIIQAYKEAWENRNKRK